MGADAATASRAVRTSGPSVVIATVCSTWTPRDLSIDRIVQPSGSMPIFGLPARNHGSIAMTSPGRTRGRARDPVVRNVRRRVHRPPDPVPTERGVDLVAGAPDYPADGRRDVAEPVAWLRGGDPRSERPLRCLDLAQVVVARRPDQDRDRGVGDPAVDPRGEIEADEVPVPEQPVPRKPVEHRIVDRDAQHLAERHRAERRVVVDVAARRAVLADHPVGDRVELELVDADLGPLRELREHRRDEPAGGSHRLDLVAAPELDHGLIVAMAGAVGRAWVPGTCGEIGRRGIVSGGNLGAAARARGGLPVPVDVVVFLDAARPSEVGSVADEALTERERHMPVGSSGGDGREAE